MPWPPRSTDLTPCYFFLWGYIKSKVYAERFATLEEPRNKIRTALEGINEESEGFHAAIGEMPREQSRS